MKTFYTLLLFYLCVQPVFSQQDSLLEKYRAMALDYNHDLRAADKNIASSMELIKAAKADLKPKLSGDANFQYTGNPIELTVNLPQSNPLTFEGRDMKYGASLSLMQPLYTGGRIRESIRLAKHQQSMNVHQAELLHSSVCYQTDMQYWNAVARRELMNIATDYRNSVASLARTIRERVEAGLVDPQDLLMAEVKLNEAEYQVLQARNSFETGRMALNSLIGMPLESETEVQESIPVVLPSDSLAASDGSYSSPGYDFKTDLDPNYAIYATLSVPIFEWGKRRNEKRSSAWKVGMANDYLNKVTDNVNLEIQTARTSLAQAIKQVDLTGSSLEKARENEQKALERYEEGKISIMEVIEAQNYRQASQINYVQAKVSAQSSYSGLIKALHSY